MPRQTGSQNKGYSVERRDRATGKPHWRVRVWLEDPPPGMKNPHIVGTFETKAAAHNAGQEAARDRSRGTLLAQSDVTVGDYLDTWLATKAGSLTANTHRDYETAIRRHIKPALGRVRLQALTPSHVQRQYDAWRDGTFLDPRPDNPEHPGRQRTGKGLSPDTIHRCHIVLRQALDFAVRDGLVIRNATAGVEKPSIPRTRPTVWTPEEVRRFLHAAMNRPILLRTSAKPDATPKPVETRPDELTPLWHLLVLEGLRKGEALGLRWQDVNWDRGTIHVSQIVIADKTNKGAAKIQGRTKTRAGSRSIRLTADTLDALITHRKAQNARRLAASEWSDNDLIVCTANGAPVNPSNVTRSLTRLVEQGRNPRNRIHDLRHTSATLLLLARVPVKVVSERLGHADASTTLDI